MAAQFGLKMAEPARRTASQVDLVITKGRNEAVTET